MPINDTFPDLNVTGGILDIFRYGNTVTHDYFGLGILIAVFFVFFIGFKSQPTTTAFGGSMIITALAGTLLGAAGLLSPSFIVGLFVLAALSVLLMYFGDKG